MARTPKNFGPVDTAFAQLQSAIETLKAADGADVRADEALEVANRVKTETAADLTQADTAAEESLAQLRAALATIEVQEVVG